MVKSKGRGRPSKGEWQSKQRGVAGQAKGCGRPSKGVWQAKQRGVAGQEGHTLNPPCTHGWLHGITECPGRL